MLALVTGVNVVLTRSIVKQEAKSRAASLLLEIYDRMESIRDARTALEGADPQKFKTWTNEQRAAAYRVSVGIEQVTFLSEAGLLDPRYLLATFPGVIWTAWVKLGPFMDDLRKDDRRQRQNFYSFVSKHKTELRDSVPPVGQ